MEGTKLRRELEQLHAESFGWALACCARDSSRAEDILQEVYVKVLGGKARFDARSNFKTWLFAVIRRTAADESRRNQLRRLLLWNYQPRATIAESPDETLQRGEVQTEFRKVLATLPPRQSEILQLVFYHDLSLSEAAVVMNISLGSARTHYDRGKKAIQQRMGEHNNASVR